MSEKKSPFKFLDYYNRKDTDIFFGREDEETKVYQLVRKNRFVLIYGPSGSGKTSLVLCGLSKQFDPSEWIPLYIRRGNNINISFLNELKSKYELDINPYDLKNAVTQLKRMIAGIRIRDLRPIYLIFDQFEELLILGNERERTTFKDLLREIAEDESLMSTHVVILLREEYFAWLDTFEQDLMGISDNRLRVEPMRVEEVKKVIKKSCAAFHVTLENEERNTAQIINVLSGKNEISLPYLQVYLDQLWKTVEAKHPNAPKKNGSRELIFTTNEINNFGNFKDVLFRFLKEQSEKIQNELLKEFPGEREDCIANILDCFVTPEGTKLPIPYSPLKNAYKLDNKAPNYLLTIKPRVLKFALDKLEDNRILRDDRTTFELAHDALSKLIDSQRDSNRRRANEIRFDIQKAFESWTKDPKDFLSYKKVKEYEQFIPSLNLEKPQLEFFKISKESREDEELEKVKSIRKFNRLKFGVSLLVLLLAVGLITGNELLNKANSDYALVYMAYSNDTISSKIEALRLANYVYDFKKYNEKDDQRLRTKIKKIAMEQDIQAIFSAYPTYTLNNKVFDKGEVDISEDGEYIFIKDQNDSIKIFHKGKFDTSFTGKNYAYFMNKGNVLLMAGTNSPKFPGMDEARNYANEFVLYDCKEKTTIKTVNLAQRNAYLNYPNLLFGKYEKPFDSYRVKFTNENGLMIPFNEYSTFLGKKGGILSSQIAFIAPYDSILLESNPSLFSVSISKQGTHFIALEKTRNRPYTMKVYTNDGTPIDTLENVFFADFTEKKNIIYIRKGVLYLKNDRSFDSISVQSNINYAYADGDQTHAITTVKNDSVFVVDLLLRKVTGMRGQLIGTDFKTKKFISRYAADNKNKDAVDTLFLKDFKGNLIKTYLTPLAIESHIYNFDSSSTLLLTKKDNKTGYHYLILLDRELNVRASFGLTPNDSYGICANGSKFYYVRDNYLNVFNNDTHLIDLLNFDALHGWMDTKKPFDSVGHEERAKNNLIFPKQRLFKIFGAN